MTFTKKVAAGQDIASADFRQYFGDFFSEFVKTGFEVSEGTGLVVDISAGTAYVKDASGGMYQIVSDATETTTLADDSTNYVFLHSDNGATYITDSTTATVPDDAILLATVVTASGDVTSVTDNRVTTPSPVTPGVLSAGFISSSCYFYLNPSGTRTITLGTIKFSGSANTLITYNVGGGEVEITGSPTVINASNSSVLTEVYIRVQILAALNYIDSLSVNYTIS